MAGNYKETITTNARITNKDMSKATGKITFGAHFAGSNPSVGTYLSISGGTALPDPAPSLPKTDAIAELTNLVILSCDKKGHTQQYSLSVLPEACKASDLRKDSDSGKYVCTLTIDGTQFLNHYNSDHTPKHTLDGATSKTLTLTYDTSSKKWTAPNAGVYFTIKCDEEQPKKPDAPKDEDVIALLPQVLVRCDTNSSGHGGRSWTLEAGTFNVGTVTDEGGVYTCTVTVTAATYVDKFNSDATAGGIPHSLKSAADATKDFVLKYNADTGKWTVSSNPAVTFLVKCLDKPYDNIVKALLGQVTVKCEPNASHADKAYEPIDGSFVRGNLKYDADNGYSCDITVEPGKYVDKYNEDVATGHTLSSGEGNKTVTLVYDEATTMWSAKPHDSLVFKVECETAPATPGAVVLNDLYLWVRFNCTEDSAHSGKTCLVTNSDVKNGYEISAPVKDSTTGKYTSTLTVYPQPYLDHLYGSTTPAHTLVSSGSKTITLTYDPSTQKWSTSDNKTITFDIECETVPPTMPADPTDEEIKAATAAVNCTTGHGDLSWTLRDGTFTVGEVTGDDTTGYTCIITVRAQDYVDFYNQNKKADGVYHTLTSKENPTFTMKCEGGEWKIPGKPTVTITVKCEPVIPTPPDKPTDEKVKELLEAPVKIECINEDATHTHDPKYFTLAEGEYEIGDVQDNAETGYTCTITVKPAKYVEAYSKDTDINKEHKLSPDTQGDKTIKLQYDALDGWYVVEGAAPVTYTVICENEPQKPKQPTKEDVIDLGPTVAVKCTTGHGDATYEMRPDNFTPDTIKVGTMTGDDEKGYTCIVTVTADKYVEAYNHNVAAKGVDHILADDAEKTFELKYKDGKWTIPGRPTVTFEVKCETEPEITYTVTYTDGVDGEVVFADQVFKDLKSGEATPKFNGTPTRKNYIFAGWNPAVADKVTANATYTATWKEDFNNNGKPDDEEERYTVTYKDGASGKAFADQVYKDLLPGVDTPEFSGKPTRKGYTFAGWSPKVADTVTKTVTYTATWKATSTTGKDKVPKTGDSGMVLILGSVMLFSFCGATAVYVFDRKRKQG